MQTPTIFDFEGHAFAPQLDEVGEPWFPATETARILGYANPRDAILTHVESEDVAKRDSLTAGGVQQTNFINEFGLYALVLNSKLESAKKFKRWVTSEVLPSIRKHGAYVAPTDDVERLKRQREYTRKELARNESRINALELENSRLVVKVEVMEDDLQKAKVRIDEETRIADEATARLVSKEFEVFEPVTGFETEFPDGEIAPPRLRRIMLKVGLDSADAKYLHGIAKDLLKARRLRTIYVQVAEKLRAIQSETTT